ncbi:MAG: YitT family protein [Clostridia bacterium]|nr:YitT family protein [Clostridia bacterium]
MKKKMNVKEFIKQNALILFGVMLTAFAVSCFYTPNKIVNGGVSGVSTILFHAFGIEPGVSFAVINIILLLIALVFIGKEFVFKTIYGAGALSLFIQLFKDFVPPVTEVTSLATIFGAILYGLGIAIVLSQGASTGGTDILGRLLQCIFPHMKIGTTLLIVDLMVVAVSLAVFGQVDLVLWGIISLAVATFAIDWFIKRLNISKIAFVMTNNGEEIAKYLISTSPRGVTIIDAIGAYTMEKRQVLLCALKESEMPAFEKKILEFDQHAFIVFSESQEILGNGFKLYK